MRIEQQVRNDMRQLNQAAMNLNTLPALTKRLLSSTELTPMYAAAKKQLAELSRMDEIKDIADKHSAIAHYAKQIQDKSLLYYAERVYARALERIGDLMKELGTAKERAALAKQHGISAGVAQSAYAMSHLPKRARDVLIEKTPPASRHDLESAGRRLMPQPSIRQRGRANGEGFRRYTSYQEPFGKAQFIIDCCLDAICDGDHASKPPQEQTSIVAGLTPAERADLRKMLTPLVEWLDRFDQLLEGKS